MDKLSLLHPADVEPEYRQLPEETVHDLSFETICQGLSQLEAERNLDRRILSQLSAKPEITSTVVMCLRYFKVSDAAGGAA